MQGMLNRTNPSTSSHNPSRAVTCCLLSYCSLNPDEKYPLEPMIDTVVQWWDDLDIDECKLCCYKSRCNQGLLPTGNSLQIVD